MNCFKATRHATAIATVSCLTLATACSSSGAAAVDRGFVSRADAICQPAVAQRQAHPFPVASFDPAHPAVSALPAVGRYLAADPPGPVLSGLTALQPPKHGAKEWRHLLTVLGKVVANADSQVAAARAADAPAFVSTVQQAKRLSSDVDATGRALGFSSSSACTKVFG